MHQISVYEPNEFTAFGFFNLDLKLIMSVSIQQKVNKKLK